MEQLNKELIDWANNLPYITQEFKDKNWGYYTYNGMRVPRVTNILETCIAKPYLATWAAGLGSVEAYKKVKSEALETGSLAHEMIEDYLIDGYTKDHYKVGKYANKIEANNAYWNYRNFEIDLNNKGYTIDSLMLELMCIGPLYGGTIDFVANINNSNDLTSKLYILDFKTSKSISIDYLIQTMMYALNINYLKSTGDPFYSDFNIQGIGIIRIDKKQPGYQYLFVDFDKDKEFSEYISSTALDMVKYYYSIKNYENGFKDYRKILTNKEVLF